MWALLLLLLHEASCVIHLRRTQAKINGTLHPTTTVKERTTNFTAAAAAAASVIDLKGKKAAVLAVHMEGNLGDLMETTPLLRRLREWGVQVDCYLSYWQGQDEENIDKRLNPQVAKFLSSYIDNIYYRAEDFQATVIGNRNYDVTIIAPGPAVNEHKHCLKDGRRPGYNVTMVWFGTGVLGRDEPIYQEEKSCLRLVAAREIVSKEIVDNWVEKEKEKVDAIDDSLVKTVLAGDLSFSFQPNYDAISQHREQMKMNELRNMITNMGDDWVVIFSRSHNFGPLNGPKPKGIWIHDEKKEVQVMTILGLVEKYPLDSVIFASSSDLEDHDHYETLRSEFSVPPSHTIICSTIEQMWALIDLAPRVVTDRYHPGVVSLIQGTKLTVTRYTSEAIKLAGLYRMQSYDKNLIRQYNEHAFSALKNVISSGAKTQIVDADMTTTEIQDWNGWHAKDSSRSKGSDAELKGAREEKVEKEEREGTSWSSSEDIEKPVSEGGWSISDDPSKGHSDESNKNREGQKNLETEAEEKERWKAMNDIEHSHKFGTGF